MSAQDTVTKNAIHTIRMYWDSFEDDIGYAREIYWGISDLPRLDMFQVDTMYLLHNWLKQFLEDSEDIWDWEITTRELHLIDYDRLFLAVMSKSFDTYPYIKKQIALEREGN